jgi:hypothetical protein
MEKREFNDVIDELSKFLNSALIKEDALQKAIKEHKKTEATEYQAELLHLYRVFCLKMYRLLDEHLHDLDTLMTTVHDLQNQLDQTDQKLKSVTERNQDLNLDKIMTDFSQYYQKTGKESKAIWLIKEK